MQQINLKHLRITPRALGQKPKYVLHKKDKLLTLEQRYHIETITSWIQPCHDSQSAGTRSKYSYRELKNIQHSEEEPLVNM